MKAVTLFALAIFAATATAQLSVVIPNGTEDTEGSSSNAFPWGRGGAGLRIQTIYDSSHFTSQGINFPIIINRLRWRPNTGTASNASSYPLGTTISLSTCPVDQSAASTSFASNQGADLTVCYSGPVAWPAAPASTGPCPFLIDIPLTTPFVYDPTLGDLNIDTDLPVQTFTGTALQLDVHTSAPQACRVYLSTGYPAGAGTINLNHGVVVDVGFVPVGGGLVAAFTGSVRAGPTPLTVSFTDTSYSSDAAGVLSWAWDFDGDSIVDSTVQNPTFTYTNCGTFNVSLTVTDASHAPNTKTRSNYIVTDVVAPSFTQAALGGGVVQFTDTSVPAPTSWAWDFDGDNVVDSTVQNPIWAYSTTCSAPYLVTLSVNRLCRGPYTSTQFSSGAGLATSTLAGGNGNSSATEVGNMFDIQVTNPQGINLCGMQVAPYSFSGGFTASLYVTPGTYVGKNLTAAPWRLIGTGNGTTAAGPFANPVMCWVPFADLVYLPPGNYGVAVYLKRTPTATVNIAYSNGPIGPVVTPDVTFFPSPGTAPGIAQLGLFSGGTTAGRVWNGQFVYTVNSEAAFGFMAPGCAGTLGISAQTVAHRPIVGQVMDIALDKLPQSVAIMFLGLSNSTAVFGSLPFDLTPFGAPGCLARVSTDANFFVGGAGNTANWVVPIPNVGAIIGMPIYTQAFVPDPALNLVNGSMSDAAAGIVGN